MINWLLHKLGKRESPFWSSDWTRVGTAKFVDISEQTDEAIKVTYSKKETWRNTETGETHYGREIGVEANIWYWFDERDDWPDKVSEAYERQTAKVTIDDEELNNE